MILNGRSTRFFGPCFHHLRNLHARNRPIVMTICSKCSSFVHRKELAQVTVQNNAASGSIKTFLVVPHCGGDINRKRCRKQNFHSKAWVQSVLCWNPVRRRLQKWGYIVPRIHRLRSVIFQLRSSISCGTRIWTFFFECKRVISLSIGQLYTVRRYLVAHPLIDQALTSKVT